MVERPREEEAVRQRRVVHVPVRAIRDGVSREIVEEPAEPLALEELVDEDARGALGERSDGARGEQREDESGNERKDVKRLHLLAAN